MSLEGFLKTLFFHGLLYTQAECLEIRGFETGAEVQNVKGSQTLKG